MPPARESQALANLFTQLRSTITPSTDILTIRALSDLTWSVGAEPTSVTYEETTLGGSPCLKVHPQNASSKHALLYFHGGGYTLGTAFCLHRKLIAHLAKACNVQGHAIDYRLAPENVYPAAHEDCLNAYQALLREGGLEAGNVVVAGDSAGAGLVVMMILKAREKGLPTPGACVLISPWLDLACESATFETNAGKDVLNVKEGVQTFAKQYLADKIDAKDPAVNALYADLSGMPPTRISVAGCDMLADDGRRLAERAKRIGVEAVLEVGEGMQHVFEFMIGKASEADESVGRMG